MRWLLHGRTRTREVKGGAVLDERCPDCGEHARFHEVEVETSAGAFFIDVVSSADRAFMCSACGEVFDLRGTDGEAAALPAGATAAPAPKPPRDLLAQLEAERERRAAADAARDQRVDDELADLKRRMGK